MEKLTKRCSWATTDLYKDYHDNEWGRPVHDDRKLFEMLILEGMQAGLSWLTILNKREAFRIAFDNFDCSKVALYDEAKIEQLMGNEKIVRNRLKIKSAITNARQFIKIIISIEDGIRTSVLVVVTGIRIVADIPVRRFQLERQVLACFELDVAGRHETLVGIVSVVFDFFLSLSVFVSGERWRQPVEVGIDAVTVFDVPRKVQIIHRRPFIFIADILPEHRPALAQSVPRTIGDM